MSVDSHLVGAWVASGLSLFIFSFLYEDNPLYKIAEHLYLGVSIGYSLVIMLHSTFIPKIYLQAASGDFWPLVPAVLGLGILTRLHPRWPPLSRISFAFIVGYAAGLSIPAKFTSYFLAQLENTLAPLASSGGPGGIFASLLIVLGVVSVLSYFFFSVEARGPVRALSRAGTFFLMIYFGASFGATVMARFSLLYGRLFELASYSHAESLYAAPALAALSALFLACWSRGRPEAPAAGGGGEENL